MAVEEPKFELLAQDGPEGALQLRHYAPAIVAETVVEGDRDTASTRGFKVIANYIFGNNRAAGPVAGAAEADGASGAVEPPAACGGAGRSRPSRTSRFSSWVPLSDATSVTVPCARLLLAVVL